VNPDPRRLAQDKSVSGYDDVMERILFLFFFFFFLHIFFQFCIPTPDILICQVEDTAADLDSYSTVTFSGGVDGCKRCRAYKQDVKSLNASLTTKIRVIKELQDKCHVLNTETTLGAPGVRGGA